MDTKKYFDDPQTIVTSTDIESLAKEVESYRYMEAYVEEKERFTPRIDFTSASNFAFFGSAEQYYDDAIKRIYQSYPYDGSLFERTAWHLSSSYLDNYIFDNEYPRTNGFIRLSARDSADPWVGTASENYHSCSTPEYISFRGGPHPSIRSKGKDITDTAGTYKSGYSNFFDQSKNRESNLKIDGVDGNTVEFWMKKTSMESRTHEVIFDTYTANATETEAGYGRMAIEVYDSDGSSPGFEITYISGSDGFQTASIGQGITSNFSDDRWHHYAFTFANSGSNLQAKLYVDGTCNHTIAGRATTAATLASAIDVTGVANDHTFTLTSPVAMGGDGVTYTFKFVHGLNEVNAGASGNVYYISRHSDAGGTTALTTAQRATALANAINGVTSPYAAFSDGTVTSVNSVDLKITADASAGDGTIDLAFDVAGVLGNEQANVLAATNGFIGDLILEVALTGGASNLIQGDLTTTVDYVSGGMYATIGTLATSPRGNSTPQLGWAQFSGALDEFRFWKTERNAQQIGRHWFTQVGGGTNTDDANTHLGVYYKFNEGITSDSSLDASVLDYSGRINNGTWTGYTSGHRTTGSAIVLSNLATASYEFKDPILYKKHPDVNDYYISSINKGKYHDLSNNASIYHSLPNWIVDEDGENGEVLKKLVQIMASYFDTLQLQIQELPSLQNVAYPSGSQKAYPFVRQALESKGFVTSEMFADASILEQFLNQSDKELFDEKLYNVKNQIYQNIYNSLSHIYKIKGTDKAFRNLIRCFGIDDEILKLNLYGNQVDYLLKDNYSSTTVAKNCVDFNHSNRHDGTIYQFTSSTNSNSVSYISGSSGNALLTPIAYAIPFTTEAEIVFPKAPLLKDAKRNAYTKMSASLFGMHTARQTVHGSGEDPGNLAWHGVDAANFQVYACRKTLQENIIYSKGYTNKDAFFLLTSSQDGFALKLTSSVFAEVYDNEKWNFAVRVKPRKYPLANYMTGAVAPQVDNPYTIEFYGVNNDLDVVSKEFLLTGALSLAQGKHFLSSSKRVYAGAHKQNFTGSTLTQTDVKFSSLRCWLDYLDDKTIQAHARDPKNIGRLNPYKNAYLFEALPTDILPYVPQMETLILNWDCTGLTGSGASNSDTYYGSSTKNASFLVEDMSSGSLAITSSYGWVSEVAHFQHTGKGDFFLPSKKDVISKEYIYSARQNLPENLHSSDTIKIVDTDDVVFTRQTVPITHFFAIEKSMYQAISKEVLKFFATIIDFNNLIGEPVERYRQDYKALSKLRQLFFERKTEDTGEIVNPDLEKYIDYYRWIDQSISKMIQQIIPGSSRFSENIRNMVESHVLERNKYWSKLPIVEEKITHSKEILEGGVPGPGPAPRIPPWPPGAVTIASPNLLSDLRNHGPAQMSIRLSHDREWETGNESKNTLTWTRTRRADPTISSGDSTVDDERQRIFDVIVKTRQRTNRTPYRLSGRITKPMHGGVNNLVNKKPDLFRTLINNTTGSEKAGLEVTTGRVEENDIVKEYKDLFFSERKKREFLTTSRIESRGSTADTAESDYFAGDTKWFAPFTIVGSSVDTGYNYEISTNFSGGVSFANLHQDTYGPHYEVPMQGPFTEKLVGGYPYRHVWSQFGPNHTPDTSTNRVEGWRLVFKEDSNGKYAAIVSPTSASIHNPRSMIWRGPKRPVNIENIRMTTGSGGHTDPANTTKLGNYRFDYNIVSTTGRKINNRYFVKNEGVSVDWTSDQKPDSWSLPVLGVPHFTTINRTIRGSNDFVFVNRFNAPGGPETMCEAFLDLESGEYSLYNCLTYRNLSVRLPLRKYLTNHSNQFGFWSDTQYSASWQTAIDSGFKAAESYAGTKTDATSDHYRGTSTSNQPMSSYHNINRNSRRRPELDGAGRFNTVTGTVHDNYWIQHPIPRTDIQYSWISASLINGYGGPALFGYETPRTNDIRRYRGMASTDLTFLTASLTGAAEAPGSPTILVDFAGINTLIYDPLVISLNTLSASSGAYRNTNIASIVQPNDLNSLILHRQGPYGWPSWKQTRLANHPVARSERKNSIFSFMFDKSLNRFTESLASPRYKPLVHVFKEGAIKHTYGNNLANYANVEVRDKLNFDIHGGNQVYDHLKNLYLHDVVSLKPELISFYYREMLYPREINVYLAKARMRKNYIVDFWRDSRDDRTKTSVTNSQGQTILQQSIWPLDARKDFATAIARVQSDSVGNDGAGELQNNYTPFFGAPLDKVNPACLYTRPLSSSTQVYVDTKFEAGNPFYDSYGDYSDEIKRAGQNYSIASEFRISEHMAYYLDDKNGDFFADREGFLTCTGSDFADSTVDNFFKTYSHTDFLKYFSVLYKDHEGVIDPNKVTYTCKGIVKLLPYKGFYPADRTLQLATLFSQSYSSTDFGSDSYSDNSKRRVSLAPFFAPGILYNSIKSGIAVDYPIYTKQPGSTTAGGTVTKTVPYFLGSVGNAVVGNNYRLSASFDYRLPFDSLVRPETYIGNGTYVYEAEPDPTARLSGSTSTHAATASVKLDLIKSDTYKLAMHNFLATSVDLFLKNGEVSTLISSKNEDIYIVDRSKSAYKMRIYLSDHQDVATNHNRTFSMYNRQSAFGPTVHASPSEGGYSPFTPPYYYSDTKSGYSYVEYSFTPWKHTVAEKYGTEGTDEYTLDEIISNSTVTNYRSVSGSTSGNSYVQDADIMNLTASVNIFQKDAHFIIQPRFETPILNFTNVTKTSPASGDASSKGMWHQKGIYETDNSKGIFLGALDVDDSASMADLIGIDKGLKKIGVLPDDNEKMIREAIVAIPVIKKFNRRTKKVETKFINVNKNTVKRALSSIDSGQSPENVPSSVYNMARSMLRYVIPPKFDFLTQLKKFGSKKFRPFAMYFFEFEHELSQEDIGNIWQNLPPKIGTTFKKEQVSICHNIALGSREVITIKELKNPDLHWMVFKVKQKAKWNYFDKVIDLAGMLPPRPDAGIAPVTVQMGNESEAPIESFTPGPSETSIPLPSDAEKRGCMLTGGTLRYDFAAGRYVCDTQSTNGDGTHIAGSSTNTSVSHTFIREGIEDIVQYARQESDVASGYGLDYSYNWPYDFCSLVELIKVDTEIHLGGKEIVQVSQVITTDGKKESVVVTGTGAKRVVTDDTREEAPFSGVALPVTLETITGTSVSFATGAGTLGEQSSQPEPVIAPPPAPIAPTLGKAFDSTAKDQACRDHADAVAANGGHWASAFSNCMDPVYQAFVVNENGDT